MEMQSQSRDQSALVSRDALDNSDQEVRFWRVGLAELCDGLVDMEEDLVWVCWPLFCRLLYLESRLSWT
jgi:hypothetical protein